MALIFLEKSRSTGFCTETNNFVPRGSKILWDSDTKKVYSQFSPTYKAWVEKETKDTASYIQAQEDAYFDNFCYTNNI
jgi:mevalonate pyrophosphate decarboxylase